MTLNKWIRYRLLENNNDAKTVYSMYQQYIENGGNGNRETFERKVRLIREKIVKQLKTDQHYTNTNKNKKVLAFSCLHAPYDHPLFFDFIKKTYNQYGCNDIVCLGDELDYHALSYHESDPDLPSAGDELKRAIKTLRKWYVEFPNMKVCESNHGSMPYRKARTSGMPSSMIKNYNKILNAPPGWIWKEEWVIDDVIYKHQGTKGGVLPHLNSAIMEMKSLVIGHYHSIFGVDHYANNETCIFGACAGCGVDRKSMAMAYGKNFAKKPIIGCLVIENGESVTPVRMKL